MAPANSARSERINLCLSGTAKRRIERAVAVEGKTVSNFIVASALENAEKAVRRHEAMALGREDARRFFDALADPPPPNDRTTFSCGLPELGRYLSCRAGKDVRLRIARAFVCTAGGAVHRPVPIRCNGYGPRGGVRTRAAAAQSGRRREVHRAAPAITATSRWGRSGFVLS